MKNILKFYFRNIFRKKSTSLITIGGFALSMAIALVLSSFVIYERSYDRHFKNHKRIYLLVDNFSKMNLNEDGISTRVEDGIKESMKDKIPQAELMCNYDRSLTQQSVSYNDQKYDGIIAHTDENFFEIFSVPILSGKEKGFFEEKNSVVVSRSFAKKLFGISHPIGETIEIAGGGMFTVSAICEDIPKNGTVLGDFFVSYNDMDKYYRRGNNDISISLGFLFVLLKEDFDIDFNREIISNQIYEQTVFKDLKEGEDPKDMYGFVPLDEIYLNSDIKGYLNHANVKLIVLMTWIAIITYLLAIFNYVNLTTAVSADRLKEIGVRKTIGAGNRKIFIQVIFESLFTCVLAFFIAFALAFAFVPVFKDIIGKEINLFIFYSSPAMLLITVGCLIVTGLISGLYPSLTALSFSPLAALQKAKTSFNGAIFRQSLNVFQFTISIAIIICIIVIMKQIDFVKHKDLGFNSDKLVRIYLDEEVSKNRDYFVNELKANPYIKNIALTWGCPGGIGSWRGDYIFERVSTIQADSNFVKTFQVEFVEGHDFLGENGSGEVLINETYKKLVQKKDIDENFMITNNIVGVVKDFHFSNMRKKIEPIMIINSLDQSNTATVRIDGENIDEALKFIENKYKEIVPEKNFSYRFYDEWFASMYRQEEKYAKTVRIFGILAIFISCLGLFGLAEFSIKKRTKEIGVRKVNGATTSDILTILNSNFVLWIIISFLLASPIGWLIMKRWLENFAYKTEISWWVFVLAGLMSLTVALLTVSWRSWLAARRNPVDALRYE